MKSRLARIASAGLPAFIQAATTAFLLLGLAALLVYGWTNDFTWVARYFAGSGALALVWLAIAELWLAVRVLRCFSPGEPLRRAWSWIALSAACNSAGAVCAQVLSARSAINPLTWLAAAQPVLELNWRQLGLILAGSFRFALLAAGLHCALKAYRRSGLIGRLTRLDGVLLCALALYVAHEFANLGIALANGKSPSLREALNWPVDPLLWLLSLQAMLIRRSLQRTGLGLVGRCWAAYAAGILLTVLANAIGFLISAGYLDWSWDPMTWYLWIPAAGAFALGPAYQWEAIRHAMGAQARPGAAPQAAT